MERQNRTPNVKLYLHFLRKVFVGTISVSARLTNRDLFFRHALTNITIPVTVTSIGEEAFYSCRNLDSIIIPDSVVSVGRYAFGVCTKLTSVSIGNGLTNIADAMFGGCSSLPWVTIPSTVITIGDSAFSQCYSLTNLVIPDTVTSLGSYAFDTCSHLTHIIFSSGLTNISSGAFNLCVRLITITIPVNIRRIDARAFAYCYLLREVYFRGNAPVGDDTAFVGSPATIYYLPGTTGWGPSFSGRPTAIWLPQVDTSPTSFGTDNNQFGFTINWGSGMTTVVEACTNLGDPVWSPVSTNTISTDGAAQFSDRRWMNYPARFYRIRSL